MVARSVKEYLGMPYTRVLVPDENGGYFAEVLELPGCLADGKTPDEAVRRLEESMEAWIEVALELGKPIPEPLASQGYSGRLVLRMPKWVHREAARRAQADGVSLNQWIIEAIGERLGAEGYMDRLIEKIRREAPIYGFERTIVTERTIATERMMEPLVETEVSAGEELTKDLLRLPRPQSGRWFSPLIQTRKEEARNA